jgi:hypothetical protein
MKKGRKRGNNMDEDDKLAIIEALALKKGTIEYLFKDYSGKSFKAELVNPEEPVGEEI